MNTTYVPRHAAPVALDLAEPVAPIVVKPVRGRVTRLGWGVIALALLVVTAIFAGLVLLSSVGQSYGSLPPVPADSTTSTEVDVAPPVTATPAPPAARTTVFHGSWSMPIFQTNSSDDAIGHVRVGKLSPECWYRPTARMLVKLPRKIAKSWSAWVEFPDSPVGIPNCSTDATTPQGSQKPGTITWNKSWAHRTAVIHNSRHVWRAPVMKIALLSCNSSRTICRVYDMRHGKHHHHYMERGWAYGRAIGAN